MEQGIGFGRLVGIRGRLVGGIGIAAFTQAFREDMVSHVHILAAGAGLPVAFLIVLPLAHIGVGAGHAADAVAVDEAVGSQLQDFAAFAGLPVVGVVAFPGAHIAVVAGGLLGLGFGLAADFAQQAQAHQALNAADCHGLAQDARRQVIGVQAGAGSGVCSDGQLVLSGQIHGGGGDTAQAGGSSAAEADAVIGLAHVNAVLHGQGIQVAVAAQQGEVLCMVDANAGGLVGQVGNGDNLGVGNVQGLFNIAGLAAVIGHDDQIVGAIIGGDIHGMTHGHIHHRRVEGILQGDGLDGARAQVQHGGVVVVALAGGGSVAARRIDLLHQILLGSGIQGGGIEHAISFACAGVGGVGVIGQGHISAGGRIDLCPGVAGCGLHVTVEPGHIGGLVVGIGAAADAQALHEFVTALLQLFAAFTGLPVVCVVVLPVTQAAVIAGGLLGLGLVGLEDAGELCIGVQDCQGQCAVHIAQGLQGTGGQVVAVQVHRAGAVDADVDQILGHAGHGAAGSCLQGDGAQLGDSNASAVQGNGAALDAAGETEVVQIACLIQDQEIIVVGHAVSTQLGAGVDDTRQLGIKGAFGGVQLRIAGTVAGEHEYHGLVGGILTIGKMDHIAAHVLGDSFTGDAVGQSDRGGGHTGEVNGGIVCVGSVAAGGAHGVIVGGIHLLIGEGSVAVLGDAGDSIELAVHGTAGGVAGVVGLQGLIDLGVGIDTDPLVAGGSLDVAVEVIHFCGLHRLLRIGHLGDGDVQIAGQAQAHQVGGAFQNAQLAQLSAFHIEAIELHAVCGAMGDDDAGEAVGLHVGDGNIVAVIEDQAGGHIVHLPAGIVQRQLAVHSNAVDAEGLQEAVIAQDVVMVEPEAFQLLGGIVGDTCGAAVSFQLGSQVLAGGVVAEQGQVVQIAVHAGDVGRSAAHFHIHALLGCLIHQIDGLLGGCGAVEHVQEGRAVAVGEVVTLGHGVGIAGGIDGIVVGGVGGIDNAVADQRAGIDCIGGCQFRAVHGVAVDGDPLAALFGLDIGVEHQVQAVQGVEGDGSAGAHLFACVIFLVGGGGDGDGARLQGGDQTVLADGGDGLVAAGPGNAVVSDSQIDLGGQLNSLIHIALRCVGLDGDEEVIQGAVRVQGDNGPVIHAEGAHLNGCAGIRLEDIHGGRLGAAAVSGHDQVIVDHVVVHGALVCAGGIAHAGQVQAGAAHMGQVIGIDHAQIGIVESVQGIVEQFAAFGQDVVLMTVAGLHTVEIGGGANVGDQGCGILGKGSVVGDLITHALFHVHDADAHAAVDDAHQTVEVAVGGLGAGGGIGPQPGLMQITIVGYLEIVGIHAVHIGAVVDIEHIPMEAACQEFIVLGHEAAGPILGIQQVEVHPLDVAVGIGHHTVQLHILNGLHRDGAGGGQVGQGSGGGGDGGLALAHGGDHTGFADGDHIGIGGDPVEALVLQIPGKHIIGHLVRRAHQQVQVLAAQHQPGGDGVHFQVNGFHGHDVQAGNIDAQTAQAVIIHAGDGLLGNDGSLAGGQIEGIQIVVCTDGIHSGCPVQDVIVVIPCHGLDGGIAGGGDVIAVNILASVTCVGVVDGGQIGNRAVLDIVGRPAVQVNTLPGAVAVVDGVEIAFVVNGQGQQLLVLVAEALGQAGLIGALGSGDADGILLLQRAVVQVDGVDGIVGAQRIELVVGGVEGHILDLAVSRIDGSQCAVCPLALDGHTQLVLVGDHVDMTAHIFSGRDGIVHIGNVHGAAPGGFDAQGAVAAVVIQGLRIDLQPAVVAAQSLGIGEAVHSALEIIQAVVVGQLVEDLVAGIVGNHDQALAVDADVFHVDDSLGGGIGLLLVNGADLQHLATAGSQDCNSRNILVVLGLDHQVAVFQLLHAQQFRHGAVNGEGVGVVSALADLAGLHQRQQIVVGQRTVSFIIFRHGEEAHAEAVAFLEAAQLLGGIPDAEASLVDVHPLLGVLIEVGGGDLIVGDGFHHIAFLVHDEEHEGGVADQGACHITDLHGGIDGSLVSGEFLFHHIGVAHEGALIVILIEEGQVVQAAGVGEDEIGAVFGGIQIVFVVGTVIHGGIAPVAVEAQNGDGVGGHGLAFLRHQRLDIDIAFHVGAIGINAVQMSLGGIAEVHGHGDGDGIAGLDQEVALADGGQQQVCVIAADGAVSADIGLLIDGGQIAGDVVQDDLCIFGIGDAVGVQIAAVQLAGFDIAALDGVIHSHVQCGGGRVGVGDAVNGISILGKEVAVHAVDLGFLTEVLQIEAEAVSAGAVGIVAQLCLDLAVCCAGGGVTAHHDEGTGQDHAGQVSQTGTLLHDGIVVIAIAHGLCGGHQQRGGQHAAADAQLGVQTGLLDILHGQSSHTGDLGRCHGGTGVVEICGAAGILAVDGIDIAAGGNDLGLQLQAAGNAPGAEIAHLVGGVVSNGGDLVGDVHGTLAVLAIGHRLCCILQFPAVNHGDGDGGHRGMLIAVHVHDQRTLGIVVDDGGDEAGIDSIVCLFRKIDGASGANQNGVGGDGAAFGLHNSRHFLGGADAVNIDVVHIASHLSQGGQLGIVGELALLIEDDLLANLDVVVGLACILSRTNRQGLCGGSGRCQHGIVHVFHIQVAGAAVTGLGPVTGVTGSHGHDDVVLGQAVKNILVVAVPGEALVAAQGQVDHITAQHDGIFDGDHVVGVIGAAVLAEDLHDDQLCVGSHALHGDLCHGAGKAVTGGDVAVGSSDTGNMGAMSALVIVVVGHIVVPVHVVDGEGDLLIDVVGAGGGAVEVLHEGIDVQVLHHGGHIFGSHQVQGCHIVRSGHVSGSRILLQCVQVSFAVEALMIQIQAGIDDGDAAACAGVTGGPGGGGAGHLGGGGHHGICILTIILHGSVLVLQEHFLDASDGCDLLDLTVGHIGGDDVGSQGQVPDHIQLLAAQNLGFDPAGDGGLILLELVTVVHRTLIGCDISRGEHLQGGCLVQYDGYADHIRVRVGSFFLFLLDLGRRQAHIGVNAVHLVERKPLTGRGIPGAARFRSESSQGTHAEHHDNGQQACHDPLESAGFLHFYSSFLLICMVTDLIERRFLVYHTGSTTVNSTRTKYGIKLYKN